MSWKKLHMRDTSNQVNLNYCPSHHISVMNDWIILVPSMCHPNTSSANIWRERNASQDSKNCSTKQPDCWRSWYSSKNDLNMNMTERLQTQNEWKNHTNFFWRKTEIQGWTQQYIEDEKLWGSLNKGSFQTWVF